MLRRERTPAAPRGAVYASGLAALALLLHWYSGDWRLSLLVLACLVASAALVGSLRDRVLPPDTLVFGEVGLVGEVRGVAHPGPRLAEAARHGFRRVVIPAAAAEAAPEGVEVIGVRTLKEALVALFS